MQTIFHLPMRLVLWDVHLKSFSGNFSQRTFSLFTERQAGAGRSRAPSPLPPPLSADPVQLMRPAALAGAWGGVRDGEGGEMGRGAYTCAQRTCVPSVACAPSVPPRAHRLQLQMGPIAPTPPSRPPLPSFNTLPSSHQKTLVVPLKRNVYDPQTFFYKKC